MHPANPNFDLLTEDDYMVAEILSNLHNAFTPPGGWAVKRRRSVLPDQEPQSSPRIPVANGETRLKSKAKSPVTPLSFPSEESCKRRRSVSSDQELQSSPRRPVADGDTRLKSKAKSPVTPLSFPSAEPSKRRRSVPPDPEPQSSPCRPVSNGETHLKTKAKSPVTPLGFSQSETETVEVLPTPKPNRRRGPKKKTLEEWKELVAKLSTERENLKSEAEELRKFRESLKSVVLLFKSYKSHRDGLEDVAVHGSIICNNSDSVLETETGTAPHPPVSIDLPHISKPETPANSEQPSGLVSRATHSVLPDLNASEGTCCASFGFLPFDFTNKNAVFAQARKMRKERMGNKIKSPRVLKTNFK